MKKLLQHFWYIGGVRKLDTETGRVSRVFFANRDNTEFGSVFKQNGQWFAFYGDEESLILQHKNNIWRVNSNHSVSLTENQINKFEIYKLKKLVFSVEYERSWFLPQFINPTYDAIDAEADDFFLYITNMWDQWADKSYSEFDKWQSTV